MEPHTSISNLPDDLLFAIMRRSLKQHATCESYIDSLWTSSYEWSPYESGDRACLIVKTPISEPSPVADVAGNLLIASVCRRWRRLVKLHVTTLLVKEDRLVSCEDLSAAVACFPNLTHLHLSDNSFESLDDSFLVHLASSCPKLTTLHVGRSFARESPFRLEGSVKHFRRKAGHLITLEGLEWFFQELPELEQVTLFCLDNIIELPSSLFQLRHLHTVLLINASALENPRFTNLTALTTLYITFPMDHWHFRDLFHLPRLAHLSTLAPHQSHQLAGAGSVTLPSCLKSVNIFMSCPDLNPIFASASPFTVLEDLLITKCSELESLPDSIGDVLPCLRKLTIRDCFKFSHLPESFTSLSRLEALDISHSYAFTTLPSNFGHLPALKVLVLEELSLSKLPASFSHLTSLEALFLVNGDHPWLLPARFSPIWLLPGGFCCLKALKALCLHLEEFVLPEDLEALASLEALRLQGYQRTALPTSFTQLSSLTSLELNECALSRLPDALGGLSSLRELKLIDSSIRALPNSLTQLMRLQTLEVRCCGSLLEMPSRLDMLVGLKRLELVSCPQLSTPPADLPTSLETLNLGSFGDSTPYVVDISKLSQLRVLKLNRVGATCGPAVSRGFPCLQQLEQLWMDTKRDSQELPIPLVFLPRLRSLWISARGICSLPVNMAAALPELRELRIFSWSSEELPGSILELRSLTSLSIESSHLTALPQGMSRLSRLRKLELVFCNALRYLPEDLTQLHHLKLRQTSVRSLPANRVELTRQQGEPGWPFAARLRFPHADLD